MFIVPRTAIQTPETPVNAQINRSASTRSRRGTSPMSFQETLATPVGRGADVAPGRPASQNTAIPSAVVNNSPVPTPPPFPVPPPAATTNGVQKLVDTMKALGMSTAGLNISYSEETVGYPGGSYVNRMINVTSNGRTEQFSADLTEKNPLVAAYDVQRYLGAGSGTGGTSGSGQHS